MQIQYNYVTLSALPELRSLYYVHFMKISLFLWLYQLIIGGFSPDSRPVLGRIHLQVHFYFPHYLPAYSVAGLGFWLPARDDFHSSKLANQTLGWP